MSTSLPDRYDTPEPDYPELPEVSPRSRSLALVLGLLGGVFGLHRFYTGRTRSAVAMVFTLGGLGVWWLYDMVLIVAGEFTDADGLPVRHWPVAETAPGMSGGASGAVVRELSGRVEMLEQQLGELAERMDFAERLITQQRERERLSKGS